MKDINKLSYDELIQLVTSQAKEIEKLKLLIAMNNARTFSKKSEHIDKEEYNLFNYNDVELNSTTTFNDEVNELETKKVKKRKTKNHENIDFESMVTETIIHEENNCGHDQNLVSEDITYKAEVKVDIKVIKHIFKTTKCSKCETITTPKRDFVFNNSIATPSLVAYVANEKFSMGTPLFRQEQAFLSTGFPLSRVNLSNYLMKGAALLNPFYKYLKYLLINNDLKVLHADETTLKVINVGDKKKRDKSYVWMYATSKYDKPIYIYEYRYDRRGVWPVNFLKDFKGYLVVDDYKGYNNIPNVTLQKCFVHARRKFTDIFKANKDPKIKEIILLIDKIFEDERMFRDNNLSAEEIKENRNSKEYLELVNNYFNHIENTNYSPNSVTGKAVDYSLKIKRELLTYLSDGNIPIDNNLAERGIKPFVINRKNFLFSNTENGARASTILMSIIFTAKTNGLDPNRYLAYLFEELHKLNLYQNELSLEDMLKMEYLLPWNEEIKSMFKVKEVAR